MSLKVPGFRRQKMWRNIHIQHGKVCHFNNKSLSIERLNVISKVSSLTINPSIIVQPLGLCREHIPLQ